MLSRNHARNNRCGFDLGVGLQAGALASILQHLKLEIFSLKRDEETLEDILAAVASLLQKHGDPKSIRHCCLALSHCADSEGDTLQVCLNL